jgi:hypothetical protein
MAESTDINIYKKLYSKLADSLSVNSESPVAGQNYLALCAPGILLEAELEAEKEGPGQQIWSGLLDPVMNLNWIYTPKNISVGSVYSRILNGKELPVVELNAAQKQQLASARAVVMQPNSRKPTPTYEAFIEYESVYLEKLFEYEKCRADFNNGGTPIPAKVQEDLKRAGRQWSTFGARGEIEGAMATIENLQGLNPNTWWEELTRAYNAAKVNVGGAEFAASHTYPAYPRLVGDDGWVEFKFAGADMTHQANSKSVEAGGGAEGSWGLFSVSASANFRENVNHESSTASGLSISVDLMRASIIRPWLDPLVFRAHTWRWGATSPLAGTMISKGAVAPGPEEADMPLLPTGVLVARNLEIAGSFSSSEQETVEKAIETSASVGWGPFSISGHYSQDEKSAYAKASVSASGMAQPAPQIIGYFCDVLPLCPSPDPSLPWSS